MLAWVALREIPIGLWKIVPLLLTCSEIRQRMEEREAYMPSNDLMSVHDELKMCVPLLCGPWTSIGMLCSNIVGLEIKYLRCSPEIEATDRFM